MWHTSLLVLAVHAVHCILLDLKYNHSDHVAELYVLQSRLKGAGPLPPIVIIPGLTSSNLSYILHDAVTTYPFCPVTDNTWQPLWPTPPLPTYDASRCYDINLATTCTWDGHGGAGHPVLGSRQGQTVEALDFGGFSGIQNLNVLKTIYETLGWKLGLNLFGAPYDWRLPNAGLEPFYLQLQRLVEQAYEANNGTKVSLIAASLGPQITLGFLHRMPSPWKDKYIHWFIAESPLWSGAPLGLMTFASGYTPDPQHPEYAPYLRSIATRIHQVLAVFPRPGSSNYTYSKDEVIVKTPNRAYTSYDAAELVADLGFFGKAASLGYIQNDTDLNAFDHPGVNTFVDIGYGLPTPTFFEYSVDFKPNVSYTPPLPAEHNSNQTGDSYVELRSGLRSLEWKDEMQKLGYALYHKKYLNQQHGSCIFPNYGPCFEEILALIVNGTIPANSF